MPTRKTWTNIILRSPRNTEICMLMRRCLTTESILELSPILFSLEPDAIVFQVGIVDCVRRALPRKLLKIGAPIPIFGSILHAIGYYFHFLLTRLFEFKEVSEADFEKNLKTILDRCRSEDIQVAFVRIGDAGNALIFKIYRCQEQITKYNLILKRVVSQYGNASYLDPYAGYTPAQYTVEEDGHHLTELGHQLVLQTVDNWLRSIC